jgi:hypothetical protein
MKWDLGGDLEDFNFFTLEMLRTCKKKRFPVQSGGVHITIAKELRATIGVHVAVIGKQ